MKIHDLKLFEAPEQRKTTTKTKQSVDQDWDSLFGGPSTSLPTTSKSNTPTDPDRGSNDKQKAMKAVGGDRTRQRMSGVQMPAGAADKFAAMDMNSPDEISDQQARRNAGLDNGNMPTVRTPQDLPQAMSNALQTRNGVVPEWHMVKHLPGYLASGIRSVGRAVFAPFTSTPIEEIQVLANLGDGPNSIAEINAVAQFLRSQGERDSEAELQFHDRIPDYDAQVKIYKAIGYTFMMVKDFAGSYIYSWPSKGGDGLNDRSSTPRLR